jgi:hypothetical protein
MIVPQSKYTRNEFWIAWSSIDWSEENYKKLEKTISERMQTLYQESLIEVLKNPLVTYINCSQKWKKDIFLFIIEQLSKQNNTQANFISILKALHRQSMVQEQGYWKQFQEKKSISIEELREIYCNEYQSHITNKDQAYIDRLQGAEDNRIMEAMAYILENKNAKDLYLYLDNISELSVDEQSRINNILYTRGSVDKDKYIRLKINNGNRYRRTYITNTWKRVQSTHDYSETNIKEEYIMAS